MNRPIGHLTRVDEALLALSKAPPGRHAQIDEQITPRLADLIGKTPNEQATGLKSILDDCAFGALASDFAMMMMDETWKMAVEDSRGEKNE